VPVEVRALNRSTRSHSKPWVADLDGTEGEDECLEKAWLWATGDTITGTNQDAQSFWLKVVQDFRSRVGVDGTGRSETSIKNRWNQTLHREVHKFISICDDIHRLNPTGGTEKDRMAMAIRRYGGLNIHDKSSRGGLPHMAACNVLKDAPKFRSLTSPPTKLCSSSLSGDQSNSDNLDIVIPGEQESAHGPSVEEQVDSDSSAGTAPAVLLRPLGRKSLKHEKKSSQIDRLIKGGEAHANALKESL
jgi:hypothetical protein